MAKNSRIVVSGPIGEFPSGVATACVATATTLEEAGMMVETHDTSPQTGGEMRAAVRQVTSALATRSDEISLVIRAVSGGKRGFADGFFHAMQDAPRLLLHHHTYAYKGSIRRSHKFLVGLREVEHIVLDQQMAIDLAQTYRIDDGLIHVVDNAFAVDVPEDLRTADSSRPTIGHMSNLTAAKGAYRFLDLLRKSRGRLKGVLAGPVTTDLLLRSEDLLASGALSLTGPLKSAKSKAAFFRGLDLFVFQSNYRFEAQPIVLFEALAHGVPVLASTWAGIPQQLYQSPGARAIPLDDFSPDLTLDFLESAPPPGEVASSFARMRATSRRKLLSVVRAGPTHVFAEG